MSDTLDRVRGLVERGEVLISAHGYDELAADDILVSEALAGLASAVLVEDYPASSKGPSVLMLQKDSSNRPIHVVWGIPSGRDAPAVLVTAYRPDPARWSDDLMQRKRR